MSPVRIGAVAYLNTKPLIHDLAELAPKAELVLDVPSRLADLLSQGRLDVLLIGDRAMRACLPGFAHAFDLGQEWHDWTGLPFVYAVWAVRAGAELGPVEGALHEAKRRGCASAGAIAHREAPRLGLDAGFC